MPPVRVKRVSEHNGFRKWLIGGIATSFLLSVAVSTRVTMFVADHMTHPVTAQEIHGMRDDIREIRADVKTLLSRGK